MGNLARNSVLTYYVTMDATADTTSLLYSKFPPDVITLRYICPFRTIRLPAARDDTRTDLAAISIVPPNPVYLAYIGLRV